MAVTRTLFITCLLCFLIANIGRYKSSRSSLEQKQHRTGTGEPRPGTWKNLKCSETGSRLAKDKSIVPHKAGRRKKQTNTSAISHKSGSMESISTIKKIEHCPKAFPRAKRVARMRDRDISGALCQGGCSTSLLRQKNPVFPVVPYYALDYLPLLTTTPTHTEYYTEIRKMLIKRATTWYYAYNIKRLACITSTTRYCIE